MTSRRRRSLRPLAGRVKRSIIHRIERPEPDPDPQRTAWLELAREYVESHAFDDAERVLEEGLAARPEDRLLLISRARLEGQRGDWPAAIVRWDELVSTRADDLTAHAWASAIHAFRRGGQHERAAETAEAALSRFPLRKMVLWEAGHVAMARGDWDTAVQRWSRWWKMHLRDNRDDMPTLPIRAGMADWFDSAWHDVAEHLDSAQKGLENPISPEFHIALGEVLERADMAEATLRVLERAVREHPGDPVASHALACARLARGERGIDLPITTDEIADVLGSLPSYTRVGAGLGPIRLIRVPSLSSIELALRTGHYIDSAAVGRLIQTISERDRWPEMERSTNDLLDSAKAWSERYGAKYAAEPHLPAETLADALFSSIYHEMALFVPMQRLATELAATTHGEPIVIEMPNLSPGYLGGYLDGDFDLVVLYFALLDLGCNAFFAHIEPAQPGRKPAVFEFEPQWRSVDAYVDVVEDPSPHTRALVPAGIRRVGQLADKLDDLVIYQSGSVVKDFAYDRSMHQEFPVVATSRLHPEEHLLPTFAFPLSRIGQIQGRDLGDAKAVKIRASIEESQPLGGNWATWLHRATSGLLEFMAGEAAADIARRGVTEAHVGDHLFVENVIVGDAVRRAGGRVVIWPHSTNPVHVEQHRADSFDTVHAITRSGADMWRKTFPDKEVIHAPDSMLTPSPPRAFDPALPLSLVFFGGRSLFGDLPVLDTAGHRALYQKLFDALADLRATRPVDVYFKPRGTTGEHEHWLYTMVGKTAAWKPVYEHPLRMDLPNMVFSSVSMGTSALIEGLARGIPGFIVREFPVVDYVTLDEDSFPIIGVERAIELLTELSTPEGYRTLIEKELEDHRDELGL